MPVSGEENIFQALFKWGEAKNKGEDFYSKSFVLILQKLKRYKKELAAKLIEDLFDNTGYKLRNTKWEIQNHIGNENKPDIEFNSDSLLAYVEVKVDWKPTTQQLYKQLDGYRLIIQNKKKRKAGFLFLLTKYGIDETCKSRIKNLIQNEISWVKVWQVLGDIELKLKRDKNEEGITPEVYYLIRDFRLFLKENGMGVEKVIRIPEKKELLDFMKMMSLLKATCERKEQLKIGEFHIQDEGDSKESCVGWWLKKERKENQYWCGVFVNNPRQLVFEVRDTAFDSCVARLNEKKDILIRKFGKHHQGWNILKNDREAWFARGLSDEFVDLEAEKQLQFIEKFVTDVMECIKEKKMR